MEITTRTVADVLVVKVVGHLVFETDTLLHDRIVEAIAHHIDKVVLDLHDVDYVDSSGLGRLIEAHELLGRAGGRVKLLSVQPRLRSLLALTKLTMLFEMFETEAEAVRSFASPETVPT